MQSHFSRSALFCIVTGVKYDKKDIDIMGNVLNWEDEKNYLNETCSVMYLLNFVVIIYCRMLWLVHQSWTA